MERSWIWKGEQRMKQFKTFLVVVLCILSTTLSGQITYLTNRMSGAQVRAAINANMEYFDDLISDTITVPLTNNRGIATKMNTNIFWLSKYFDLEDQVVLTNKMRGSEVRAALNRNFELLKNRDQNYVEFKSVQPATINQVTFRHNCMPNSNIFLDWGDGNVVKLGTTGVNVPVNTNSNYVANNTTYTIRVFGQLKEITNFHLESEPTLNYLNYTQFSKLKGLRLLTVYLVGTTGFSGNLDSLPRGLLKLNIYGGAPGMNVSGTMAGLPSSLRDLTIRSFITANITGDISQLTDSIRSLDIRSNSNIVPNINSLPKNLTRLNLDASNKPQGSIDSLPRALEVFMDYDVSGQLLTGSTDNLPPGLKQFRTTGAVNLTGDARLLPSGLQLFTITGAPNFTVTSGEFPMWGEATITLQNEWITEEVDTFLNSWQSNCATGTKTINLAGTNQPRSSASDAAVTDMQSNHSKAFIFTTP